MDKKSALIKGQLYHLFSYLILSFYFIGQFECLLFASNKKTIKTDNDIMISVLSKGNFLNISEIHYLDRKRENLNFKDTFKSIDSDFGASFGLQIGNVNKNRKTLTYLNFNIGQYRLINDDIVSMLEFEIGYGLLDRNVGIYFLIESIYLPKIDILESKDIYIIDLGFNFDIHTDNRRIYQMGFYFNFGIQSLLNFFFKTGEAIFLGTDILGTNIIKMGPYLSYNLFSSKNRLRLGYGFNYARKNLGKTKDKFEDQRFLVVSGHGPFFEYISIF